MDGSDREHEDLLPEYTHYRDTGCEVSESCLRCPLVRCKYDPDPAGRRDWLPRARRSRRDAEVLAFYGKERPTIRALAKHFGISIRTAHRVLASARQDGTRSPESVCASRDGSESSQRQRPCRSERSAESEALRLPQADTG